MNQKEISKRTMEIRTILEPVEIRTNDQGKQKVVGYAAKFNSRSQDLGGFVEQIDPHFFDSCMEDDCKALINHDANLVLGRTTSKTCELSLDSFGLRFAVDPPDTSYANDLIACMQRGDINQCSFAFQVDYEDGGDDWQYDEANDIYVRTLLKCKRLYDVSVVTYPAYEQTESVVSARSIDKVEEMRKLRDKNYKKSLEIKRKRLDLAEKNI